MASDLDKMNLRLPAGLRERIKAAAADNRRTMNAEAVFRLERDFKNEKGPAGAPTPPSHDQNPNQFKDGGIDA